MADLEKNIDRVLYAGSPGTAGAPAYVTYKWTWVCYPAWLIGVGSPSGDIDLGASGAVYSDTPIDGLLCQYMQVPVVVPAVPGTPGTPDVEVTDYHFGWNAAARSVGILPADGYIEFRVDRSAVGVVVGLASQDSSTLYQDALHGLYFAGGQVHVIQAGAIDADIPSDHSYSTEEVWRVERTGASVLFSRNGAIFFGAAAVEGALFLKACLYAGGDAVRDPAVVAMVAGSGELAALRGGGLQGQGGVGELAALGAVGRQFVHAAGALAGLDAHGGDSAFGHGGGILSALDSAGEAGVVIPAYGVGAGTLASLGSIGTASDRLRAYQDEGRIAALDSFGADGPYAVGRGNLASLVSVGVGVEGNRYASVVARGTAVAEVSAGMVLAVVLSSVGAVSAVIGAEVIQTADVASTGAARDNWSLELLIDAILSSAAAGRGGFDGGDDGAEVWAVNLATSASTRYERFPFNSFARIGDRYYAAAQDGIYLLEGEDDAGEQIDALAVTDLQAFGTSQLKRLGPAYLGVSSDGLMRITVRAPDGQAYTYSARRSDPYARVQRVDVGQGLRANYFRFEVANTDGGDFELSSLELSPVILKRRI
ncbi:hypothetical protein GPA19_05415 [Azoarcus indigens]|uniref:Uncharacterized protein n=1 Tax=Azoarcus indigens TaxID=29545 RepID=A0A4V6PQK4_9RHOO|nr:hypothetical protein [Azoarcus indigens]NMG64384.1 hypothetical protein [Azoarcus indigens]TDN49162.1 hypothetical protein C7389_11213 [Azoarcus indigens]